MDKVQIKKAEEVVRKSLEEVTKLIYKLLEEQDNKHKMFVMEGAMHAIIHSLEHEAPSGLYSTQFVIGALNDVLLANIQQDMDEEGLTSLPDDSEVIH